MFQDLAKPVRIVAAIRQWVLRRWQSVQQQLCAGVIRHMPGRQQQADRVPRRLRHGVQLGVASAPGQANQPVCLPPFLSLRLAAVRWAFRCVASIVSIPASSPCPASSNRLHNARCNADNLGEWFQSRAFVAPFSFANKLNHKHLKSLNSFWVRL